MSIRLLLLVHILYILMYVKESFRRPVITTLYDVVCNIRDDEQEHVLTMSACQDPKVMVQSPNTVGI